MNWCENICMAKTSSDNFTIPYRKFSPIHGVIWTFKVEAGLSFTECWTGNENEENQSQKLHFSFRIYIWVVSAFLLERLISNDSYDGIYYIYLSPYHTCVTFKEVRTVVTFYKTHCDYWKISSFLHNMPFLRKFRKIPVIDNDTIIDGGVAPQCSFARPT